MDTPDLMQAIAEGPSERFEIRKDAEPDEVGKIIVAFLNTQGGTLLIGADEHGRITGLASPDERIPELQSSLQEGITPSATWSAMVQRIGGKDCLWIDVPEGSTQPYAYRDQIYVRTGRSTRAATATDISALIGRRIAGSERWERQPALGFTEADLHTEEVRLTGEMLRNRLSGGSASLDVPGVLAALDLTQPGQLLNSAVVLFGRAPAHRYPQTRVRVAVFADESRFQFKDNRVLEGHAFSLVEQVESFFNLHVPIASELQGGTLRRSDRAVYPPYALREALMNALVHRDYSTFDATVSIALYPDRVEFWNPGRLPAGLRPEQLKSSGVSRPPNPDIAHVFFIRGLIERWGIGTRRIAQECRDAGLPEPEWLEVGGGIRLTLRQPASDAGTALALNDRQARLLGELGEQEAIDAQQYHIRFAADVTPRTARRDLAQLAELGYLQLRGRGKYVRTARG